MFGERKWINDPSPSEQNEIRVDKNVYGNFLVKLQQCPVCRKSYWIRLARKPVKFCKDCRTEYRTERTAIRLGFCDGEELDNRIRELHEQTYTDSEIGKILGCHYNVVRYRRTRMGLLSIPHAISMSKQRYRSNIALSSVELETIDGLVLGDGYLGSRNDVSAWYAHGTSRKETLYTIVENLPSLEFLTGSGDIHSQKRSSRERIP